MTILDVLLVVLLVSWIGSFAQYPTYRAPINIVGLLLVILIIYLMFNVATHGSVRFH